MTRDPLADRGYRLMPGSADLDPETIDDLLAVQAAVDEGDRLSRGESIPGAPGACVTCGHMKPWHGHSRFACEKCDCRKYVRPATA